jgi:hypothetical protein
MRKIILMIAIALGLFAAFAPPADAHGGPPGDKAPPKGDN